MPWHGIFVAARWEWIPGNKERCWTWRPLGCIRGRVPEKEVRDSLEYAGHPHKSRARTFVLHFKHDKYSDRSLLCPEVAPPLATVITVFRGSGGTTWKRIFNFGEIRRLTLLEAASKGDLSSRQHCHQPRIESYLLLYRLSSFVSPISSGATRKWGYDVKIESK